MTNTSTEGKILLWGFLLKNSHFTYVEGHTVEYPNGKKLLVTYSNNNFMDECEMVDTPEGSVVIFPILEVSSQKRVALPLSVNEKIVKGKVEWEPFYIEGVEL